MTHLVLLLTNEPLISNMRVKPLVPWQDESDSWPQRCVRFRREESRKLRALMQKCTWNMHMSCMFWEKASRGTLHYVFVCWQGQASQECAHFISILQQQIPQMAAGCWWFKKWYDAIVYFIFLIYTKHSPRCMIFFFLLTNLHEKESNTWDQLLYEICLG